MKLNCLFRSFRTGNFCYRASFSVSLARRLSCSSIGLKRWSFHERNNKNCTTLQSFKFRNQSTAGRWISFQRNCSSSNINDFESGKLEKKDAKLEKEAVPGGIPKHEHPNRRTIFVGSLNFLTDEEKLREHFSKYGEIEHIRIIRYVASSVPKSYGFVLFKSSKAVEKALQGKNVLDSRLLEVEKHDRDVTQERKIHVKGFPPDLELKDIKDYFSQYGDIKVIDIPWAGRNRKDFGFVEFLFENSAIKALQQQTHEVKGHALLVSTSIAKQTNTVPGKVVADLLPDEITLEDVRKYFEQFGQLNSIDMVFKRDSKNFGFLSFQNQEIAKEVTNSRKSHYIRGQQVIVKPMHSTAKFRPVSSREKKVFVEGIPLGKTEDEILAYFNQFGEAINIHLIDSSAAGHMNQCGILRFKRKTDVDNLLAYPQLLMEDSPLRVRRLGFTAETSSDYTPLYSEFRKKHKMNSADTEIQENPSKDEETQGKALDNYPKLD